jgi:lipopolysaccharide export LptBFGC system permease protein LptF
MPQSRKRHGHHEYRKPSDIPSRQRTKGRITWAILFAVFGLLVAFFAAGDNYTVLIAGAILGAAIGYVIGKNMEKEAAQ